MCPVRQSKSIVQADARKQALCSQRTSYAHRPRRRLSVRSGLAVLGYEADCQKLTSEGGSPVLPTNHSLQQQRQHGKIPLDVRCLMKKIRPSSHPLSPYFQHFTPSCSKPLQRAIFLDAKMASAARSDGTCRGFGMTPHARVSRARQRHIWLHLQSAFEVSLGLGPYLAAARGRGG